MRLSHEQRAARRLEILACVRRGDKHAEVAEKFGITRAYVSFISAGIVSARRTDKAMRRTAIARELAGLGITRRKAAELMGIWPTTLSAICSANQIEGFVYDKAGWENVITVAKSRADIMAALYRDGYTLEQIAQQFDVSRERVRQLLGKYNRMNGDDGGLHVRSERNRQKRAAAKDMKFLKSHGCTHAQWQEVRAIGEKMRAAGKGLYQTPLRAFCNQRNNARRRKIGWELTFWQWWTIWQQSGHWEQRGIHHGEYVMCRIGDAGPYSVGNVFIALSVENIASGKQKKRRDLPVGVSQTKSGKYVAHRRMNGKTVGLGTYATPELAYAAYLMAGQPQAQAA